METFAALALTSALNIRTDYTYTDAKDDATGVQLLNRARNKASLTAAWRTTSRLTLSGQVLYVGPALEYNRSGSAELMSTGYTLVNLAANYAVTDRIDVFGRINNLLNQQYQEPVGFLRPGFGIYGGLKMQIGGVPSNTTSSNQATTTLPNPAARGGGSM